MTARPVPYTRMKIMKRYVQLACGLACLAAFSAAAAEGLSAAQIVEKNVAARGGLKAWRAVVSMTLSGKLGAGGKSGAELPFVLKMKRPHKSRLELTFAGQTALQVYDGAHGWKVRPFLGREDAEPFSPAEAKAARRWTELDGPLIDHERKGIEVELAGSEKIEGKGAYKLKLTTRDGAVRHLWVDASTFLEVKIDGQPRKMDGRLRHVSVFYRDYRSVQGLKLPYVLETVVAGVKRRQKMTFERVAVNPPLDDALFAKPLPAGTSVASGAADASR